MNTDHTIFLAVTDPEWFSYLRKENRGIPFEEVNFWSPSAPQNVRVFESGELLLFKLKGTRLIVGGGVFHRYTRMPTSLAWKVFETGNGATTEQRLRTMLQGNKHNYSDTSGEMIGCRFIAQPVFFEEEDYFECPPSWKQNIVTGKRYSCKDEEGLYLWWSFTSRARKQWLENLGSEEHQEFSLFGRPTQIQPRLGNANFRAMIFQAYNQRCAITSERTLPVLEAAHIKPYASGGEHSVTNGLLLRSDLHKLFDSGYVTVTPDHHFEVSHKLKEDYQNGKEYYRLQGKSLEVLAGTKPDAQALIWHNDNCFLS